MSLELGVCSFDFRKVLFAACLLTLTSLAFAPPKKHHRGNPSALRKNLRDLRQRKAALQKELHSNKVQSKAVLADIQAVDQRLDQIEGDLEQTGSKLEQSRDEQQKLTSDLAQTTKDLEDTRQKVSHRLRELYMTGDASVVSVLMGSKSAGDLASREFLVQRVAQSDKRLFERYKQLKAELATRKARQDQLVVQIGGLLRHQESQKVALADTRQEKNEKLQSLRERQDELKKMIAQFDADERNIAAQIAAFARRTNNGQTLHLGKFSGHFLRPVSSAMTSGFGMRFHPILHRVRMHTGVDFGCPVGTTIHAAGDGVVIMAQRMSGYGNTIVVQHGGGMQTLYGHCSSIGVGQGQRISRGQVIGRTGNSGLSTGPHLHFEVRINGRPVNPVPYL